MALYSPLCYWVLRLTLLTYEQIGVKNAAFLDWNTFVCKGLTVCISEYVMSAYLYVSIKRCKLPRTGYLVRDKMFDK